MMRTIRLLLVSTLGVSGTAPAEKDDTCSNGECVLDTFSAIQRPQAVLQQAMKEDPADHEVVYPVDLMTCAVTPPLKTESLDEGTYDQIIEDFKDAFDGLPRICQGMNCPVADVCGCILRMAGHDFMDFANGVGGSDACTDMAEGDNAGLKDCLVDGLEGAAIDQVYEKHCAIVSLADFVVIAAQAAMTYTRQLYLDATAGASGREMIDFKTGFKYGRTTNTSCPNNQPLPNPSLGCADVERVFVNNLGLDWKHAAALMGVHTLGRASMLNSGFFGWWSDSKNSRRFNNNYFVSLYLKGWIPEQTDTGKWQWGLSDKARDDLLEGHQMMLDTDMCLAWGDKPRTEGEYLPILAADEKKTCAWTIPNLTIVEESEEHQAQYPLFRAMDEYNDGKFCSIKLEDYQRDLPGGADEDDRSAQWDSWYTEKHGQSGVRVFAAIRGACCNGCKSYTGKKCKKFLEEDGFPQVTEDTGHVTHPNGVARQFVMEFANHENVWIEAFLKAWHVATTNGQNDLTLLME